MAELARIPATQLVALYSNGENTRTLGVRYSVDPKTIWRHLRCAGVTLRKRGLPEGHRKKRGGPLHTCGLGYLKTYGRGREHCLVHRGCWEAYHGPIPDGHDVHHINGNRGDNRIENLKCLTKSEHGRIHGSQHGKQWRERAAARA